MLGRFVIGGLKAEGAQGRVFSAIDQLTDLECVLKIGSKAREEALLAFEFNHPYIVSPLDAGPHPDAGSYAAYPFVKGRPLREYWYKAESRQRRRTALHIVEFLSYIHSRGWLYNDFKPDHFFITANGVEIIDLGLCSRFETRPGAEPNSTFSGTFPFIAPERLLGRPQDQRSDIFALGMMFLDLFIPSGKAAQQSVGSLSSLRRRLPRIKGFWREFIEDMTAMEPSQRPASTEELWKRLIPKRSRECVLFFPVPGNVQLSLDMLERPLLVIHSTSELNLEEAEKLIIAHAWKSNSPVIRLDLSAMSPDRAFISAGRAATGELPADLLSALRMLQSNGGLRIILMNSESLKSEEAALLHFALSTLSRSPSVHMYLLTTKQPAGKVEEGWTVYEPPPYFRTELEHLATHISPSKGIAAEVADGKKLLYPEDVLSRLQDKIRRVPSEWWPSAAWRYRRVVPFEKLTIQEKRIIAAIAMLGGQCTKEIAGSIGPAQASKAAVRRLTMNGYLREAGEKFVLAISSTRAIRRFRSDQIQGIARSLLPKLDLARDSAGVFEVARILGKKKTAVDAALRKAREYQHQDKRQEMEWTWRAFRAGASMSALQLDVLTRYFLHEMKLRRVQRLMKHSRSKHGMTFRLADRYLDYLHRSGHMADAAAYAERRSNTAERRGNSEAARYFLVRRAGFLILSGQLKPAEDILDRFKSEKQRVAPRVSGMIHHFRALLSFNRGDLLEAVASNKMAIQTPHRFIATSYMNLGISEGLSGNLEASEKSLATAIDLFAKAQDTMRLSSAFNNIGILYKNQGDVQKARDYYYKSIHLSKATHNQYILAAALDNLANTFAQEGRTALAIDYYNEAIAVARKAKLPERVAASLTNAGLQHAVRGQFQKSFLVLKRALKMRQKLGLGLAVADTQEYLGLAYFLLKPGKKSQSCFEIAEAAFLDGGAKNAALRVRLYRALCDSHMNQFPDISGLQNRASENSLEMGLYHFVAGRIGRLKNTAPSVALNSLHEAERIFRKISALYWVAKTLEEKAMLQLTIGRYEKALLSAQSSWDIFCRLEAKHEMRIFGEKELMKKIPESFLETMSEKLPYQVLVQVKDVLKETNIDRMVDRILAASLELTGLERAVLILEQEPQRIFKSVALDDKAIREIREISLTSLEATSRQGRPFLLRNADTDINIKSRPSIIANRITSIACIPLNADDRMLGYLYLDSREGVETLAATDEVLLQIFASVISMALRTGLLLERSEGEREELKQSIGSILEYPDLIANSRPMLEVLRVVQRLMDTEFHMAITGETGTGKEAIARVLHYCSRRKEGPFVAVNGSAITETLLESEFFGHEKGSFTGATSLKRGLFEEARNGTLFIDEIGDMPLTMQAKLLRVLQEGEFRRVGGTGVIHSNARVIAATNRDLTELVKQKQFREDLYYRIRGAEIHLPPLRARTEDILPLALFFLRRATAGTRKKIRGFSPESIELMKQYSWVGNVRQLRNEVERIAALSDNTFILPSDFDEEIRNGQKPEVGLSDAPPETLREMERQIILKRLQAHDWNINRTARSLGVTRNGLYSKMKLYNLPREMRSE